MFVFFWVGCVKSQKKIDPTKWSFSDFCIFFGIFFWNRLKSTGSYWQRPFLPIQAIYNIFGCARSFWSYQISKNVQNLEVVPPYRILYGLLWSNFFLFFSEWLKMVRSTLSVATQWSNIIIMCFLASSLFPPANAVFWDKLGHFRGSKNLCCLQFD